MEEGFVFLLENCHSLLDSDIMEEVIRERIALVSGIVLEYKHNTKNKWMWLLFNVSHIYGVLFMQEELTDASINNRQLILIISTSQFGTFPFLVSNSSILSIRYFPLRLF